MTESDRRRERLIQNAIATTRERLNGPLSPLKSDHGEVSRLMHEAIHIAEEYAEALDFFDTIQNTEPT